MMRLIRQGPTFPLTQSFTDTWDRIVSSKVLSDFYWYHFHIENENNSQNGSTFTLQMRRIGIKMKKEEKRLCM